MGQAVPDPNHEELVSFVSSAFPLRHSSGRHLAGAGDTKIRICRLEAPPAPHRPAFAPPLTSAAVTGKSFQLQFLVAVVLTLLDSSVRGLAATAISEPTERRSLQARSVMRPILMPTMSSVASMADAEWVGHTLRGSARAPACPRLWRKDRLRRLIQFRSHRAHRNLVANRTGRSGSPLTLDLTNGRSQ